MGYLYGTLMRRQDFGASPRELPPSTAALEPTCQGRERLGCDTKVSKKHIHDYFCLSTEWCTYKNKYVYIYINSVCVCAGIFT